MGSKYVFATCMAKLKTDILKKILKKGRKTENLRGEKNKRVKLANKVVSEKNDVAN